MHQDTKIDIRPCTRRPSGRGVVRDLTQNWHWAEQAIAIADRFFRFDFSKVWFSGHVTEDEGEGHLQVEVWSREEQLSCIRFVEAGMAGFLVVETADPENAFTQDILRAIRKAVNETRGLRFDPERLSGIKIDETMLTLTIDLKP